VLYNYPVRGDEQVIQTGYPAPPRLALRIYGEFLLPHLVTRVVRGGESFADAISWARHELESDRDWRPAGSPSTQRRRGAFVAHS
jgi:hypothetical protein